MDWSRTNGQNIAEWSDRTTLSDFSQDRTHSRTVSVSSITDMSVTGGDPSYLMTKWAAKVTTATPHGFATGQKVTFAGTGAEVTMAATTKCTHGPFEFDKSLENAQIHALDATSFAVEYGVGYDPCFVQNGNLSSFKGASSGNVTVSSNAGASLELAAQLVAATKADSWFNVPFLASDDYVMQMATLLKAHVPSDRKIYIEYSNEIWNYGFIQWSMSYQMAALHGHNASFNSNKAEQWWNVKRSLEIHKIFDTVFGAEARTRVVRVLATQMSTSVTTGLEQALNDSTANPGLDGSGYDVLAVAPYFGSVWPSFNARVANNNLPVTDDNVDEMLDHVRDGIWDDLVSQIPANVDIAKKYRLTLVHYLLLAFCIASDISSNIPLLHTLCTGVLRGRAESRDGE